MDLVELKFIWEAGFFTQIRNLFKGKKNMMNSYITIANYDKVHLDNDEINLISKKLKLPKQRILRCFALIILAKLDPKDAQVHQRFGQEIKKKL
jgi:hypothetical protein